jgi:hypothetical protein
VRACAVSTGGLFWNIMAHPLLGEGDSTSPTAGFEPQRASPFRKWVKALQCADHHLIRIRDERERLVAASSVMTKSWGPSWGKQLPGERPLETAETWPTSPQPCRHAEEHTARAINAYALYACLQVKSS